MSSAVREALILDPNNEQQMRVVSAAFGRNPVFVTATVKALINGDLLTQEPTDPAVRVFDKDGDVWASHEGQWRCLTMQITGPLPWSRLVEVYGPLSKSAAVTL